MKLLLSLLALGLCGVLYLEWRDWPPGLPAPPATVEVAAAADGASAGDDGRADEWLASSPGKEDYASVVERPLFLPDRRPPPEQPEDIVEPETEEPSDLTGTDVTAVIITPDLVTAWVRSPKEPESIRLRIGDDYEGWTVKGIEPDRLLFERQGDTDALVLRDYENAPKAIPPTRLPGRGQRQQAQRQPAAAGQPGGSRSGRPAADNSSSDLDNAARGTGRSRRRPAVGDQSAPAEAPD